MTVEKTELFGLAFELDSAAGDIGTDFVVLEDIKENFLQLVEDMNNLEESENLETHFDGWHRELRILSQLMYHSVKEFKEHKDNIRYLSEGVVEIAKGGEK